MELRNAVDHMAAGKAEVCHAHLAVRHDGHILPLSGVVGIDLRQMQHQAAVDLLHDAENARQLLAEQINAPALKCLLHNGVVRVGERPAGDVPRLLPRIVVLIDQQPHQLRHAQRRVGVVDVDGDLVREIPVGMILLEMLIQDALERRGNQQILLPQPQALALDVIVGRIEHLGDGLGHRVALERADVIPARERGHVKAVRHACAPKHKRVDRVAVVAGDKHVVRHRCHGLIIALRGAEFPVFVHPFVDMSAEAHLDGLVLAGMQPHVAHFQPVVREFHLPAVNDLLLEDTELIADGEARDRVAKSGRRVHIARRQPPEAAVSEARVGVHAAQALQREALLLQDLVRQPEQAEIVEIVSQRRADKKFHRHVIDLLALLFAHLVAERAALLLHQHARIEADHTVHLLFRRILERAAEGVEADLLQPVQ